MRPRLLLVALSCLLSLPVAAKDPKAPKSKGGPVMDDEVEGEEEDPDWDGPGDGKARLGDQGLGEEEDEDEDEDIRPTPRAAGTPSAAAPEQKAAPKGPEKGVLVDTTDKVPLVDNYPLRILARDLDAVVVELPVLIARRAAEFPGKDWWLVAEVTVDGKKVSESRTLITATTLSDLGPTVIWWKSSVPVHQTAGAIEVKVSQLIEGADNKILFSRAVAYAL